jgi:hypothetical protein
MRSKQSLYRHRFTRFADALIPVYNRLFEVLAGRRHEAFRAHVMIKAWGLAEIWPNLAVLVGIAAMFIVLSAAMMRREVA